MWWLLVAGLGFAVASEIFKRSKLPNLPDISDEEFLRLYREKFTGSDAAILEGRQLIADSLGLPYKKLSPQHKFSTLAKYTGFITEYEVGVSDLGDELAALCDRAAMQRPQPFPSSVGELIYARVKVKDSLTNGSA